MAITVNIRYKGKEGAARKFAMEMMDSGVVHFVFDQSAEKSAFLVVIIGVGSPTVENSDAFSVGL